MNIWPAPQYLEVWVYFLGIYLDLLFNPLLIRLSFKLPDLNLLSFHTSLLHVESCVPADTHKNTHTHKQKLHFTQCYTGVKHIKITLLCPIPLFFGKDRWSLCLLFYFQCQFFICLPAAKLGYDKMRINYCWNRNQLLCKAERPT